MVVNQDSRLVFNDEQFVNLAIAHVGGAAEILKNYATVVREIFGEMTRDQANGLGYISLTEIVPFYLNLPNHSRASFFGIDDALALNFVSRFPILRDPFQICLQVKAELAQWNPSFSEAALLTGMLFFNCYPGSDAAMVDLKQQVSNACNLILWKLSNGSLECFEQICTRFSHLMNLLSSAKDGMLTAMAIEAQHNDNYVMTNLSTTMAQNGAYAESLFQSSGPNPSEL